MDPAHAFRLLGMWQGREFGLPAAAALIGQPEDTGGGCPRGAGRCPVAAVVGPGPLPVPRPAQDVRGRPCRGRGNLAVRDGAILRVLDWYLHTVDAMARIVSPHREQVALGPLATGLRAVDIPALDEALNWCEGERDESGRGRPDRPPRPGWTRSPGSCQWPRSASSTAVPTGRSGCRRTRSHWPVPARWGPARRGPGAELPRHGFRPAAGLREAVDYFEQALALRSQIGDQEGEAQTANNLADTYLRLKRYDQASSTRLNGPSTSGAGSQSL